MYNFNIGTYSDPTWTLTCLLRRSETTRTSHTLQAHLMWAAKGMHMCNYGNSI